MKPVALTAQEQSELIAFMKTLTSNLDPTSVPVLPR
jgi:cytochrome c peroxidase